jgi:chromosome segregation ATPase
VGAQGLGYYVDHGSEAAALANETEAFEEAAAVAGVGGDGSGVGEEDAPIVAALASHRAALADTGRSARALEEEVARWSRASAALRHEAEVLEVRLTDQLQQLERMKDDCATAEGRLAVKEVVGALRALGARLLRISQGRGGGPS